VIVFNAEDAIQQSDWSIVSSYNARMSGLQFRASESCDDCSFAGNVIRRFTDAHAQPG
jgi:hypothetical protein